MLFGCQLGGGTDINRAVAYCQTLITRPTESVFVLISDLYEGGIGTELLRRVAQLLQAGVTVVALLALSDSGAPSYDHDHAAGLAALGVPAFACTPDLFPDLLAVAISGGDVNLWLSNTTAAAGASAPSLQPSGCVLRCARRERAVRAACAHLRAPGSRYAGCLFP